MSLISARSRKILTDNRYRYLAMVVGFFLFVAPFAFFTQIVFMAVGNVASPDLHSVCFRMPIDWLFGGRWFSLIGSISATFIFGVVVISVFTGPVFCGWLCPLGSVSEAVSRATPIPDKFRFRIRTTGIAAGMRMGFLVGFASLAMIVGYKLAGTSLSGVCCRYCNASLFQNFSSAIFGSPEALLYWHTGSMLVLGAWLVIGGVAMSGGRGWCMFFCPLGALSGIAHKGGARLGFYKTEFHKEACKNCASCQVRCPMWAIRPDQSVERVLCNNCNECTHACVGGAYRYERGKDQDTDQSVR